MRASADSEKVGGGLLLRFRKRALVVLHAAIPSMFEFHAWTVTESLDWERSAFIVGRGHRASHHPRGRAFAKFGT